MSQTKQHSLAERLDRIYRLCEEARGRPLHISVVMLAQHRQVDGVRSALESLTLNGAPGDAMLNIFVMVMPDKDGSGGAVADLVSKAQSAGVPAGKRGIHFLTAERPYRDVHCLFPYGRTVHRGVDEALKSAAQRVASSGGPVNHVIVRVSGDVIVNDNGILAKLVKPLDDPAFAGVVVSSAIQDSDWKRDELPRRLMVKPRMLELKGDQRDYIPCESCGVPASLSAYMAPMFTELGMSQTWGGGEDGVGFSLADSRLKGVVVRNAVVYHCHAGRSLTGQLLSFGDWLYTGPVNRLNRISARLGVDQTRAYDYFMTHGVVTGKTQGAIGRLGRVLGCSTAIHVMRFCHAFRISLIMVGAILRK